MLYKSEGLGFSFELPEGWRHERHMIPTTFFGPNGRIGQGLELIQMQIGKILPQYIDPGNREKYMAEPGAEVYRSKLGNESNVIVLKKISNSEISAVHDGMQYSISHSNDEATLKAVEQLKESFEFPSLEQVSEAILESNDSEYQATLRSIKAGSPEEARRVLREAGMPPVIERPGYTIHRIRTNGLKEGSQKGKKGKKWWQFWR